MKRSVQEIIELAVFGLAALLIGTGALWLAGWVLGGLGWLLQLISGLLWALLRFVVPVALAAGLVYLLVRWLQGQTRKQPPAVVAAEVEPDAPLPVNPVAESREVAEEAVVFDPNDSWHPPVADGNSAEEAIPGTVGVFTASDGGSEPADTQTETELPAAESRQET